MASWSFIITISSVDTDITAHVDVMSIVKTRRLHSEMKPNSNSVQFRCKFDSGLFQKLLAAETVDIAITKDATAYFTGSLSPNYQAQVRDGAKYIDLIAEDWNIQKLGQTVTSLIAYAGYDVCKPSDTASSIVHSLITAAGCTAGTLDAIATTIPLFVVQTDDKATYADLLTNLLFQYGFVYFFDDDGTVDIAPISNSGAVTTTTAFTDAAGSSNIIGALAMSKSPEKYDDIRVTYDKLEQKTGIVLFQDTTGATGADACQIQLEANGDANGKDYYPLTSGTAEVFSEWGNPDGLKIWAATSAAISSTIESGITLTRALTNYYKRCSFAYRNGEATPKLITKLTITGDAYVIVSRNTARATSGKKLLEIDAKYVYADVIAQALLQSVAQYYKYSDISFTLKSKTAAAVGSYALVTDSIYSGTSTKCRVIDRTERSAFDGTYEYRLEAVADFASVAITAEAKNESAVTQTPAWFASNGYKMRLVYNRSATKPATPTGSAPAGWQETPPLPAINPLWSSWIYVRASGEYIDPLYPDTDIYPDSGLYPSLPVTWSEVEYVSEDDPQIAINAAQAAATAQIPTLAPKYLGRFFASHPVARNPGDWWTTYNTDGTNRGVWYDLAGVATQVTTTSRPELFVEALTDVAWAEEQGTYGTASDYGIATLFQSLGIVNAFIASLVASDAFIDELSARIIKSSVNTGTGSFIPSGDRSKPRTELDLPNATLTFRDDISVSSQFRKIEIGPSKGLLATDKNSNIIHDIPSSALNTENLYQGHFVSVRESVSNAAALFIGAFDTETASDTSTSPAIAGTAQNFDLSPYLPSDEGIKAVVIQSLSTFRINSNKITAGTGPIGYAFLNYGYGSTDTPSNSTICELGGTCVNTSASYWYWNGRGYAVVPVFWSSGVPYIRINVSITGSGFSSTAGSFGMLNNLYLMGYLV